MIKELMLSKPRFDRSIDLVNKTKETTRFIFNAGKIKKRGISAFFAKFRGILAILLKVPGYFSELVWKTGVF